MMTPSQDAAPATPNATPTPERDANGKFAPGNRGGTGNPFARRVAQMRRVILDALDEKALTRVVNSMIEQAEKGDVAAARLLLQYSLGKPAPAVQPDRMDIDEYEVISDASIPTAEWMQILMKTTGAKLATDLIDHLGPIFEKVTLTKLSGMLVPKTDEEKRAARKEQKRAERRERAENSMFSPSPRGFDGDDDFDEFGFPRDMEIYPDDLGGPDRAA